LGNSFDFFFAINGVLMGGSLKMIFFAPNGGSLQVIYFLPPMGGHFKWFFLPPPPKGFISLLF